MITTLTNHRSLIDIETPTSPELGIDVMLDIETLGTRPGSVVLSIGAVRFDRDEIYERFESTIDPSSSQKVGLKIDAETVVWWFSQSDKAKSEFIRDDEEPELIIPALVRLRSWMVTLENAEAGDRGKRELKLWGNGAAFDNVLLRSAYEACDLSPGWEFWNDRCYRTMKNLFPNVPLPVRDGVHHRAIDDAVFQAKHLSAIFKTLNP